MLFVLSLLSSVPAALGWLAFEAAIGHVRLPSVVIQAVRSETEAGRFPLTSSLAFAGASLAFTTVTLTLGAGIAAIVASMLVRGERPSLGRTIAGILPATGALAAASLLVAALAVTGVGLAVVPGMVAFVGCAFVGPILVLERTGVVTALRRSWRLSRGRRWKLAATLLLCGLVVVSATSALAVVGTVTGVLGDSLAGVLAEAVLSQAIAAAGMPILFFAVTLLYFDARVEIEGLDIEVATSGAPGPRGTAWRRRIPTL